MLKSFNGSMSKAIKSFSRLLFILEYLYTHQIESYTLLTDAAACFSVIMDTYRKYKKTINNKQFFFFHIAKTNELIVSL